MTGLKHNHCLYKQLFLSELVNVKTMWEMSSFIRLHQLETTVGPAGGLTSQSIRQKFSEFIFIAISRRGPGWTAASVDPRSACISVLKEQVRHLLTEEIIPALIKIIRIKYDTIKTKFKSLCSKHHVLVQDSISISSKDSKHPNTFERETTMKHFWNKETNSVGRSTSLCNTTRLSVVSRTLNPD